MKVLEHFEATEAKSQLREAVDDDWAERAGAAVILGEHNESPDPAPGQMRVLTAMDAFVIREVSKF